MKEQQHWNLVRDDGGVPDALPKELLDRPEEVSDDGV